MPLQAAPIRYYVHGDAHEDRLNVYYCARCDQFAPVEHFADAAHVSTRAEKYRRSLKSWMNRPKASHSNYYRPAKPENMLAELAAADIKAEKSSRSAFFRWLLRQAKRDDPIGDFARDAESDTSFPRTTTSLESIRSYLLFRLASSEAIVAFDEACDEFKTKRRTRSGISLALRFAILKRDAYRCRLCGASAHDGSRLEVDHKLAVANGGTDDEDNLWTLCFACNRGKSVSDL